ncbi:MAG: glycosyltransferase family 1 protein [Patescibacteria group bacterium]|nr:glycosyltransferase family 1 protein [Patescibacteria group bacterium]
MDKKYSGVSWCTLFLLEEILRQDKENEYLLFYNSGRDLSSRISEVGIQNSDKVKIVATHYPNKIFNYILQKILRWPKIDKLLGGVDVFWSPHFNFAALSKQTRHILTVHDLSFLITPDFFSARKNFWHKVLNVRKMMADADVIAAISENTKQDIIRLTGINADKIKVIYDGVSADFHPIDKTDEKLIAIKNKYNLPDKFILYLGTIEPRKNIIGLIKAFEQVAENPALQGYQLVIAGSGGWKNSSVFQAVNNSEFKDRINLVGYLENSEKAYYYNLCSIFCYPSFYEGFGLPVLEAMACGAPVITSDISSLPEVAGDAALLINPADINSISRAIIALAGDEKLREIYSVRGVERAKLFSWRGSAQRYAELFKDKKS